MKWFFSVILFLALSASLLFAAVTRKMPDYSLTGNWKMPLVLPEGRKNLEKKLSKRIESPKGATWKEATVFFENSKALPKPTSKELTYEVGFLSKKKIKTQHLPETFIRIYGLKFTDSKYGLKTPPAPEEAWLKSFGNILQKFKELRGKAKETEDKINLIKRGYPQIWQKIGSVLPQLVRNDFLYSDKWDPWKDGSSTGKNNDGLLFLPYWKVKPNSKRHKIWNGDLSEHKVYQGGVVIYADLKTIKKVERDYGDYGNHVGMGYLAAAPLKETFLRGKDAKGDEFIALELFVRQDLPFPYDSTKYTMRLLDYYNESGLYISDYYSENRTDLNWMAGRDTFFKIKNTNGEFVAWLIATELGFDIKNLPERDNDRVVSIKGAWGNIKLISEGFKGLSKVGTSPGKMLQ